MLLLNVMLGIIIMGIYYIAKQAYYDKKYSKMILYILIGIMSLAVIIMVKEHWKNQIKDDILSETRHQSVMTTAPVINEPSKQIETTVKITEDIPLAKIPGNTKLKHGIGSLKNQDNNNLFESDEYKFRIIFPKEWILIDSSYPLVANAVNFTNNDEIKLTIIKFPKMPENETFQNATKQQRNQFVESMLSMMQKYTSERNVNIKHIDDGYFSINGKPTIWITVHQSNMHFQQQAYYYFIAKNKQIYMLSYFSSNDFSIQPQSLEVINSIYSLEIL